MNAAEQEVRRKLMAVDTDSVWWILNEMGYPDTFVGGLQVLRPDLKLAGRAVTLRYLPIRPDLASQVKSTNRVPLLVQAADATQPGDVLVAGMGGELGGGFIGDVIASRFQDRGGAGLVADGATRDITALRKMDLPVYVAGGQAAASWRRVVCADMNIPVRCGGITVLPGDYIVGDAQGVIAVPADRAAEVADRAAELEGVEEFVRQKLHDTGVPIHEIYPPTEEMYRQYRESLK